MSATTVQLNVNAWTSQRESFKQVTELIPRIAPLLASAVEPLEQHPPRVEQEIRYAADVVRDSIVLVVPAQFQVYHAE